MRECAKESFMKAIGWRKAIGGVSLALALTGTAVAAQSSSIYSQPLFSLPGYPINCTITNVGQPPVEHLTVSVIESTGNGGSEVGSNSYEPLKPGETARQSYIPTDTGPYYFCQFTFSGGSAAQLKGEIELDQPFDTIPTESLPLVVVPTAS
jgi:hypothetical protein